MNSSLMSRLRSRRRSRLDLTTDDDDSSVSSSRPGTKDGRLTSTSRLSADSGAGSLEDFHRGGSSPLPTTFLDYWDGVRRHTAPPRKISVAKSPDAERPNTVHAWDAYPIRSTMSKYTPLPSIGLRQKLPRKYCFQEDSSLSNDISSVSESHFENINFTENSPTQTDDSLQREDDFIFRRPRRLDLTPSTETSMSENINQITQIPELELIKPDDRLNRLPLDSNKIFTIDVDSEADSDFDDSCESCVVYTSDEEDEEGSSLKPRKPVVRSATFTIEDKRSSENLNGFYPKLLLAVRLPDGSRVSGYFDARDTLRNICELAMQNTDEGGNLEKFELVTTEVPKRVFSDFSLTLSAAGIEDKTLLNLQEASEDSSDSG